MLSTALLGLALTLAPTPLAPAPPAMLLDEEPRSCPDCGAYEGPNAHLIYDPFLRQVDVWPEFDVGSCSFEVSAYRFVTLGRAGCQAEQSYRARVPASRGAEAAASVSFATTDAQPRDCPDCGTYGGPNAHLIYDPFLRQVDVWPEFEASSCSFEVAAYRFVTLGRAGCQAERSYRTGRVVARATARAAA